MKLKKILAATAAALLAMPVAAPAQHVTFDETQALFYARDISAAAFEFCSMLGQTGTALGPSKRVSRLIRTSGSSVTTTSSPGYEGAFVGIDVGDEITLALSGARTYRYVATNADDDTVTVDTAWDLGTTGYQFEWRDLTCGTAANSGQITAGRSAQRVVFDIQVLTINATSIDFQVYGRNPGAGTGWTPVGSVVSYTATGGGQIIVNQEHYAEYRLGDKVTGDAGAQSVTVKVTVIG